MAALPCRSQYDTSAADGPLSIVGVGRGLKPLDICVCVWRGGEGGGRTTAPENKIREAERGGREGRRGEPLSSIEYWTRHYFLIEILMLL